jgi:hypothetical protein
MRERLHKNLALQFFKALIGDGNLPPEGVTLDLTDRIDVWAKGLGLLPLCGTRPGNVKYRIHQDDRNKLRDRINSGARCMSLPQNRRFKCQPVKGREWRVVPFEKAAKRQFEGIANSVTRRVIGAVDLCEQDLSVAIANDDGSIPPEEIRLLKDMLFEMTLIRNVATHFAGNIAARVAHAIPQMRVE